MEWSHPDWGAIAYVAFVVAMAVWITVELLVSEYRGRHGMYARWAPWRAAVAFVLVAPWLILLYTVFFHLPLTLMAFAWWLSSRSANRLALQNAA